LLELIRPINGASAVVDRGLEARAHAGVAIIGLVAASAGRAGGSAGNGRRAAPMAVPSQRGHAIFRPSAAVSKRSLVVDWVVSIEEFNPVSRRFGQLHIAASAQLGRDIGQDGMW
jgi:hypothetical protein